MKQLIVLMIFISSGFTHVHAQIFKKLKEKVADKIEQTTGIPMSSQKNQTQIDQDTSGLDAEKSGDMNENGQQELNDHQDEPEPGSTPIEFPTTGILEHTVYAVLEPVIEGDIKKLAATEPGQYAVKLAREKGLEGSDEAILIQLMDIKNAALAEEIKDKVRAQFPGGNKNISESGMQANPAWGGLSLPSLSLQAFMGKMDIWFGHEQVKFTIQKGSSALQEAFDLQTASIVDLEHQKAYSICKAFGLQYTMVDPFTNFMSSMLSKELLESQMHMPHVKLERGPSLLFGKYQVSSIRITLPVTGDSMMYIHCLLNNRWEEYQSGGKNFNPNYQLVWEVYFTNDLDPILPDKVKLLNQANALGNLGIKGQFVGFSLQDEEKNAAVYWLNVLNKDLQLDRGQFQIPPDYPVKTQEEVDKMMRQKFGM